MRLDPSHKKKPKPNHLSNKRSIPLPVKVSKVDVIYSPSVQKYLDKEKDVNNVEGLNEILTAIQKPENWSAAVHSNNRGDLRAKVDPPKVPGHPSHPAATKYGAGAQQYNIERGNQTVDRCVLKEINANMKKTESTGESQQEISVKAKASVVKNVH